MGLVMGLRAALAQRLAKGSIPFRSTNLYYVPQKRRARPITVCKKGQYLHVVPNHRSLVQWKNRAFTQLMSGVRFPHDLPYGLRAK